jgi:hypothetical protein
MLGCRTLLALLLTSAPPEQQALPLAPDDPPPPTGKAMLGLGITGIVFGALNISGGISILAIDPTDATFLGWIPLGFGAAFVTLGALGTHYGNRRRLEYRAWSARTGLELEDWQEQHPGRGRAPGRGLVIGGSVLASGGLALFVSGLSLIPNVIYYETRWPIFNIVSGAAILAGSGAMIGIGAKRVHRHRRARAVSWMPSPWLQPHGFGLGVSGRF